MLLSKGNFAVVNVASKDTADHGLNCIRLNGDGSTVAANGNVIMAVGPVTNNPHFPEVGEHSTPPLSGVSIGLDLVEKVVRNIPKEKKLQHVALTKCQADPRKLQFTTTDMQHTQRVEAYPRIEPFPDWAETIRRFKSDGGARLCVNRRDLIELLSALQEACPDKGGENPVYIEISPDSKGMILRCLNRDTGQRSIGAMTAYNTKGEWLPTDSWEKSILGVVTKTIKKLKQLMVL